MKVGRARVTFLHSDEGGAEHPFENGFMTTVGIEGILTPAIVRINTATVANPGETHQVEVAFVYTDYVGERLRAFAEITFNQERRLVARGAITEVYERRSLFPSQPPPEEAGDDDVEA